MMNVYIGKNYENLRSVSRHLSVFVTIRERAQNFKTVYKQ